MPASKRRSSLPHGAVVARWIERHCHTPTGRRKLSREQRAEVHRLCQDDPAAPPSLDHLDDVELAACLLLNRLCGKDAVPQATIAASAPPGAFLLACKIAKQSPLLWPHLRINNGRLTCPELGAALTP